MKAALFAVLVSMLLVLVAADTYLHNPRGMNDRCDEESNDRDDEQRMYNSNDNSAGGYAWCDQEMVFYEGTSLHIEYTAQHSCGNGASNKDDPTNPESTICQVIMQVGCDATFKMFAWGPFPSEFATYQIAHGQSLGRPCSDQYSMTTQCLNNPDTATDAFTTYGNTCTQRRPLVSVECPGGVFVDNAACNTDLSQSTTTFNSQTCQCSTRKEVTYGYHEPENWYIRCVARQRNGGLFTANQQPGTNNGAENTRQEPNSNRYGYECTEERDYFPYFYPTPWIDVAIYSSEANANCSYYLAQTQNVADRCECLAAASDNATWSQCALNSNQQGTANPLCPSYHVIEKDCKDSGFTWTCYGNFGLSNLMTPYCGVPPAQTDNRLGNFNLRGDTADSKSMNANLAFYDWNIPTGFVDQIYSVTNAFFSNQGLPQTTATDTMRCTLRLRYNISTAETLWNFDYMDNGRISTNPVIQYGTKATDTLPTVAGQPTPSSGVDDPSQSVPVRLAVNTAQYGRTFQDRTYVFQIKKRSALPALVPSNANIWNVNVRGKRGNIAQVRNCLEYDYVPNNLNVAVGDWVLFQWCGSDYNDQNNAGEGKAGTDRSNVVAVIGNDYRRNYPTAAQNATPVFSNADLLALAWIGQNPSQCYNTLQSTTTQKNQNNDPMSCHFLNGPRQPGKSYMPTAYFYYFAQVINSGTLNFINSRNNNFSNRSQKGTIIAGGISSAAVIAASVVGAVVGVALIAGLAYAIYAKKISFGKFSSRV